MIAINNGIFIVVGEENIIYYKIINTFLFIYISNKPKTNLLNIIFNKNRDNIFIFFYIVYYNS
jgi:hypothetical protein